MSVFLGAKVWPVSPTAQRTGAALMQMRVHSGLISCLRQFRAIAYEQAGVRDTW
jgi:hypothetical protein